jgi:hypothetical protein
MQEDSVPSSIRFARLVIALALGVFLWSAPASAASGAAGAEVAPTGNITLPALDDAIEGSDLTFPARTKPAAPLERYAFKGKKRKHRKRNKKIAKAIGAAIIAGVVIGTAARVARGRHEGRGECRRWRRSCAETIATATTSVQVSGRRAVRRLTALARRPHRC